MENAEYLKLYRARRQAEGKCPWHPDTALPPGRKSCDKCRATHYRRRYGMEPAEFEALLRNQGGVCAVCGTSWFSGQGQRPHVDHDHFTGEIRGLLCTSCNTGLGAFRDSPDLLHAAALYLNHHRVETLHGDVLAESH